MDGEATVADRPASQPEQSARAGVAPANRPHPVAAAAELAARPAIARVAEQGEEPAQNQAAHRVRRAASSVRVQAEPRTTAVARRLAPRIHKMDMALGPSAMAEAHKGKGNKGDTAGTPPVSIHDEVNDLAEATTGPSVPPLAYRRAAGAAPA